MIPIIAVNAHQLTKSYQHGGRTICAVSGIDLSIHTGELVMLVGAPGSGKTTLLSLVGCLEQPSSGTLSIESYNVMGFNDVQLAALRRRKIGIVPKDDKLVPALSVQENIIIPSVLDSRPVNQNHFQDVVNIIGIQNILSHYPNELSAEQQRCVAIARACISHPSIMIADEPTHHLDKEAARRIMQLFSLLRVQGYAILLASRIDDFSSMSDRVIELNEGKVRGI